MAVKAGYKQTEIGVIPEDWEAEPMGALTILMTNGFVGKATQHYVNNQDGILYIQGYNIIENGFNFHGIKRVSHIFSQQYSRSILRENDLLTIQTGDIGVSAVVGKDIEGANCHALIISRFIKRAHSPFYCHYFNSHIGRVKLKEIETGSTMKHLNVGDMKSLLLPFPPLTEQQAIATALSDVDELIASLDKLIAKKRDIKQATMQQLLTGKTRLKGFCEEWVKMPLSKASWYQEGPGVRNTQFTTSGIKLLNGTNIVRGKLCLENTNRFISEQEAFGPYAHFMADEGDIVIASSGITIERLHEKVAAVQNVDLPFCMNTSTIRFKPNPQLIISAYLYHYLSSDLFKMDIGGYATGSAQLNYGPSHLNKIDVFLPIVEEQQVIAEVLSDMDAEITELEQRRNKTIAIKQGMMQELLTGRTRLI